MRSALHLLRSPVCPMAPCTHLLHSSSQPSHLNFVCLHHYDKSARWMTNTSSWPTPPPPPPLEQQMMHGVIKCSSRSCALRKLFACIKLWPITSTPLWRSGFCKHFLYTEFRILSRAAELYICLLIPPLMALMVCARTESTDMQDICRS